LPSDEYLDHKLPGLWPFISFALSTQPVGLGYANEQGFALDTK
jgi:hypothetical protein